MRARLSQLITQQAKADPNFIMLSGDHGYALFDELRRERPDQFLNVGVAEQLMISLSSGLTKVGYRPMVYGLSAFIPIRVVEQIKLDLCHSRAPVVLLGDGAGLVYSTLGVSHQSGEDLAVLQALPDIQIFTPADEHELAVAFRDASAYAGPSYIRIGKSDRPPVGPDCPRNSEVRTVNDVSSRVCVVSMGSLLSFAAKLARENNLRCLGIPRVKPFPLGFIECIQSAEILVVIEEHSSYGGLAAAIHAYFERCGVRGPLIKSFALVDQFTRRCGSYQYALSEHGMSDANLTTRLQELLDSVR